MIPLTTLLSDIDALVHVFALIFIVSMLVAAAAYLLRGR